jgi:hypothetical protein
MSIQSPQSIRKKEEERRQLNQFRSLYSGFPDGKIEGREEPDFLIHCQDRMLGIELTDLYWENTSGKRPHQEIEALNVRIVESAGKKYDSKRLPPLQAFIHFNPYYAPSKQEVESLSTKLADLFAKNIPQNDSEYSEYFNRKNKAYFPNQVNSVTSWLIPPNANKSCFTSPESSFIPKIETKQIEGVLRMKELKLECYREKCQEVWLIISCDREPLSTMFQGDKRIFETNFKSSLDRVFLFRHAANQINELLLHV